MADQRDAERSNLRELMAAKIFPRNLTAQADRLVAGNPASSRLESGVGNDYPGLEFDHRNLDRRFFPGLIFEFASQSGSDTPNPLLGGIRLVRPDTGDPDLVPPTDANHPDFKLRNSAAASALADALNGNKGTALSAGVWFIDEIEQAGVLLRTYSLNRKREKIPLDGLACWRFVRSLEPGSAVKIKLGQRPGIGDRPVSRKQITLSGWRRRFLDHESGVIDLAYSAGEMTQSLCSPWMHDFRDCGCNYWASNHPDIVLTEDYPGEPLLPTGGSADPRRVNESVDWLRADRNRDATAEAFPTDADNRPYQMDHYEINRRWQQLGIVLEGKEISQIYRPGVAAYSNPYDNPAELAQALVHLATLEHTLTLEYLYAYFSIAPESEVNNTRWPGITDAVIFARHELLMIAISEMRHLRWANQIIWQLEHAGLIPAGTGPSLGVAKTVPTSPENPERKRELRLLTPETLRDFIAVEAPSGTLDGQYARVSATLRKALYPAAARQLAGQIISDGIDHFSRFREVNLVLRNYISETGENHPYLLSLRPAPADNSRAKEALGAYKQIVSNLRAGYSSGDMEDANFIILARGQMAKLQGLAQELANDKLGLPFFDAVPGSK
jgi:Ferritin-like